jgi:thiol-disulfide isomerase/thioredoxin
MTQFSLIKKKYNFKPTKKKMDAVRVNLCADCSTVIMLLASSWCGPCKAFKPVKDELLAQDGIFNLKLDTKIHYQLYESDVDGEVHKAFGVKSFPTILVFSPNTKKFVKYEGPRTADAISSFAASYHNGQLETPVSLWQTAPRMLAM